MGRDSYAGTVHAGGTTKSGAVRDSLDRMVTPSFILVSNPREVLKRDR
jgi:hypothetical protein